LFSDLRHALRQLAKSPAFAVVAVATLALGIGACTAMFSIVDAVLLRPLPFHEPERLVWIENIYHGGLSGRTSRVDTFNGWKEQNRSFTSMGAYYAFSDYFRRTLTGSGEPENLRSYAVSMDFLPTLGVRLLHGRNFTKEECAFNGPHAAILTYAFWMRHFSGDPSAVGRTISLSNNPTTIVGVLPPEFDFASVFTPGSGVEMIEPLPLTVEVANQGNTVFGIGRLRPGATVEQAQAELSVISERLHQTTLKDVGGFGAYVRPLDEAMRGGFRGSFLILACAVGCVLAIACVNLSNLQLARINSRRQEFAVRIALGAGRMHLIKQALTESLLLAAAGSLLGVLLAMWATAAMARIQTFGIPLLQNAAIDPAALAFTVGITALAGVACGLLPALHVARSHRGNALQESTHQRSAGRSAAAVRNALVVAELALACMLLVGAGLLFRSFSALLQVNLGFQPRHAMVWRVDAPRSFNNRAEAVQYFDGAERRVTALPGVETAGLSDTLPLGRNRTWGVAAVGVQYPPGSGTYAFPRMVDQHYLQAMQIPLKAGRYFDDRDTATSERAVVINESLARKLWPDRDAVGQSITQDGGTKVIGVVANVRHGSLEEEGSNEMYFNFRQSDDWNAMEMVIRSARAPASLVPEVRSALAAYDSNLPTSEFYELEGLIDNAVAPRRLITRILGVFSSLAVTLAAIGLYGVIAYSVTQRTQEIGIRMAVGAQRGDILGLVLRGGLRLAALGVGLGLVGCLALTRLLRSMLFGITAHDPLVLAGNVALLVAVALAACILPALRATRVEPVTALRSE